MENKGQLFTVYAVKDELTRKYLQPIFMESDPEAIRWFKYVLNKTELWKQNAAMYSLYKLGYFNDVTGFGDYPVAELVQGGLSVLEKGEPNA